MEQVNACFVSFLRLNKSCSFEKNEKSTGLFEKDMLRFCYKLLIKRK